jgi:two-component system aerobic respiration control sensor histidine kinase ArcB
MSFTKEVIELLFSSGLFINALLFIPQAIKIFKEKSAKSVSLSTFVGFLLIQFAVVLHGVINHDSLLIIGYLLSMITCGAVVILSIIYRSRSFLNDDENISLEKIFEQMPGHVYWKNKEGVFISCNTNNWKDFGLTSLSDFQGKTDYDLFSKEQAEKIRATDLEVIRTEQEKIIEEGGTDGDGINALFLSHKIPLRNAHKKIIGLLGISINITDAKKAEIERLNFLENIIALMPGHVYWVDRNGIYLGCNDNQAQSAGLASRKDIIGKRNKDLPWNFNAGVLPETLDKINQEVMTTGKSISVEEPALLHNEKNALFLSHKAPIYNNENEIIGMVGISFDITAQREAEKELRETQEKLEGMTLVSASIAHELRTPLANMNVNVSGFKGAIPELLKAYKLAKEADLINEGMSKFEIAALEKKPDAMQKEVRAALTFIDMLLLNLNPHTLTSKLEIFSINQCIEEALSRYPYVAEQHNLVRWEKDKSDDFSVKGEQLLIIHALFNLIKNALYYVLKAGKGDIQIWTDKSNFFNKLYFKDSGTGISSAALPHVFDKFYSNTHYGAGVGLTFCKWVMENLGGSITCESVEGSYTLFILSFPIL